MKPVLITRQSLADEAADKWLAQYNRGDEWKHRYAELKAECERDPRAYVNKYGTLNSVEGSYVVGFLLGIIDCLKGQKGA